mgnify:CR=1 FL=1
MLHCGLLGETLGHSYSPMIHHELGDYDYRLFEVPRERLGSFLTSGSWDGLNVTIPYKKAVVPYCTELSDAAATLQSVNTIVRRPDGTLYGDNTDLYGFLYMVRRSGISPAGKKALVLGSGGASVTVKAALEQLGAHVTVISRSGPDNYTNLDRHADAEIIANTTPVGMYPHNGSAAVDLKQFPCCRGVLDIVYNPARTALILQAEELGIPHASGLSMLVAQAKRSSEQFSGTPIDDSALERVERIIHSRLRNIILIGMPGCGKSTVGKALAERLGRQLRDADQMIADRAGCSIPEIFAREGEEGFRARETEILGELGKQSGLIIATGGGCVTREENYPLLHQNGTVYFLKRGLSKLPKEGRPLSQKSNLETMYEARLPQYRRFADRVIDNDRESPDYAVEAILRDMEGKA